MTEFVDGNFKYSTVGPTAVSLIANSYTLTTATIPSTASDGTTTYNVTQIGNSAFSGCTALTSVSIPSTVTLIGSYVFDGCSNLTTVNIPSGNTLLNNYLFRNCVKLSSISIPSSVTSMYSGVFYGCSSLTSVTIPDNVTYIGNSVFYGCSSLKSITVPNSVTSLMDNAFLNCTSLESVILGKGITAINYQTFANCTSLATLTIAGNLTTIGASVFNSCNSLTAIKFKSLTPPTTVSTTIPTTATIYARSDALSDYQTKFGSSYTYAVLEGDYKKITYDNIPVMVDSAIKDGNGKNIADTYVDKTSTQEITGIKTFSNGLAGNVTGNCSGSSGSCTGNAATATTATKLGTSSLGGTLRPIYLVSGAAQEGTQLYEKTLYINGTGKTIISSSDSTLGQIYAPTQQGESGYILQANGATPTWANLTASLVSAGTLKGKVLANATSVQTYSDKQVRNITLSTSEPSSSDGANGDVWLTYE